MGHVPSLDICEGLILVVVDIFTGEDVGDTGAAVGKKVGLDDRGACDGMNVGCVVMGALDGRLVGLGETGADDGRAVGAFVGVRDTGDGDGRMVGLKEAGSLGHSTAQEQGQLSISSSTCCRVKPMSINKAQSKKPCPAHPRPIIDT